MKTVYIPITQEAWDEFKKLAIDRKLTIAGLVAEVVIKEVEQSRETMKVAP